MVSSNKLRTSKVTIDVPKDLIMVTTKNTLLSAIGIVSSLAVPMLRVCMLIDGQEDVILVSSCRCLDGMVNIIVMYLMFAHSEPYYRTLCKLCHDGVQHCCFCVTHSAVLKRKAKAAEMKQSEMGTL